MNAKCTQTVYTQIVLSNESNMHLLTNDGLFFYHPTVFIIDEVPESIGWFSYVCWLGSSQQLKYKRLKGQTIWHFETPSLTLLALIKLWSYTQKESFFGNYKKLNFFYTFYINNQERKN